MKRSKKEYLENAKRKQAVEEEIRSVVEEAKSKRYRFERHCGEYQRYIELAKGDVTIAKAFFEKAYTLPDEELQRVYGTEKGNSSEKENG